MKIKSSVLFGLIVVIFSVSGFSLLKRLTKDVDEWRPSDVYSTTNVSRRSTYSVVSSGASASYSGVAPSVSSGASSMFRRRAVSSYAPAYVASSSQANSQYPIGGTPSNSVASPVYTTSSAEFRSFGGGGNAGGVSMSGGSVKSSGSSVANASGLNVSMPSTSMYAFAVQGANNNIPVVSGDAAIASVASASSYTTAYSGIGYATGGGARGLGGRQNAAPSFNDPWWNWFDSWMGSDDDNDGTLNGKEYGSGGSYTFDRYELYEVYEAFLAGYWNSGMGDAPSFDEWLDWYISATGENGYHYNNTNWYFWQPVGDVWPLVVMLLFYAGSVFVRKRKQLKVNA